MIPRGRRYECDEDRITLNVAVTEGGCWEWLGSIDATSQYGRLRVGGRTEYTHRFAHEVFIGPIPNGMEIDHLCRNRRCCAPAHLEAVTPARNLHRAPTSIAALNAAKRECKYGHGFTPENTYIDARGCRGCRICRRTRVREHYYRTRSASQELSA